MRPSECLAQYCLETAIPNATIRYVEDQSGGQHDFDLILPDSGTAALEVTRAEDEAKMRLNAAIFCNRRQPQHIELPSCATSWVLELFTSCEVNVLHQVADTYLASLEADGVVRYYEEHEASRHPSSLALYRDHGVRNAASVAGLNGPSRAFLQQAEEGGIIAAQHAVAALEREARKDDNLAKLAKSEAVEKHLFVLAGTTLSDAWVAIVDGETPAPAPKLPDPITHVWIAARGFGWNEVTLWGFNEQQGWHRYEPIRLPECGKAL